jgi:hypothetical protein
VEFAIPLEDKYKFKERSRVLHDKWMEVLRTTEKTATDEKEDGGAKEEESSEVKTDGDAKENGIGGDDAPAATNGNSEAKETAVVKEVEMRDTPQEGGDKVNAEEGIEAVAGKEVV